MGGKESGFDVEGGRGGKGCNDGEGKKRRKYRGANGPEETHTRSPPYTQTHN